MLNVKLVGASQTSRLQKVNQESIIIYRQMFEKCHSIKVVIMGMTNYEIGEWW